MAEGQSPSPPSAQLQEDLWSAVANSQVDKVRDVLEQGADPNHELYWSKEWTKTVIKLRALQGRKVRPPPLHMALLIHNCTTLPMVKLLVEHGADLDKGGGSYNMTPVHWAADQGIKQAVEYLVMAGCKLDTTDMRGHTPLARALARVEKNQQALFVAHYLVSLGCGSERQKVKLLVLACQNGRLEIVKELIEKHNIRPTSISDEVMDTLLRKFSSELHYDVAQYLILSCGVNDTDENKAKLLCGASSLGKLDLVKELVEQHKINPDHARDNFNRSPVILSCLTGKVDTFMYLVKEQKCNLDVSFEESPGRHLTPLETLLRDSSTFLCYNGKGFAAIALHLINLGYGSEEQKAKLLSGACSVGSLDVVRELVEKHHVNLKPPDLEEHQEPFMRGVDHRKNPISYALERLHHYGNRSCVDAAMYLVNQGCGSEQDKVWLLIGACRCGKVDAVKELIEHYKLDPKVVRDVDQKTLMEVAMKEVFYEDNDSETNGCVDVGLYLLSRGCGTEQDKATLLCGAYRWARLDAVEELVSKYGLLPKDARDYHQNTPLHFACINGRKEIVADLIENQGCSTDVRNAENSTPLHQACWSGNKDIVVYLVEEQQCSIDVTDDLKRTPLFAAKAWDRTEVVEYIESLVKS